ALKEASWSGARIASIHPVKSFADVDSSIATFSGTFCGIEGEESVCRVLTDAFTRLGAHIFAVKTENKMIYHAATVMVCNYLTALMEVGLRCYEQSGLTRQKALEVMQPIVQGTVDNIFCMGTASALTGPIARGDHRLVEKQIEALEKWDTNIAGIYIL